MCADCFESLKNTDVKRNTDVFDHHVLLKRLRPSDQANPWFNRAIELAMRERDICYAVWKARKTDEKDSHSAHKGG
jgi:hypothetical protein